MNIAKTEMKKGVLMLLAFMTLIAIAIAVAPKTTLADEAVSFEGEDIEKGQK